jgi:hypothetical protein
MSPLILMLFWTFFCYSMRKYTCMRKIEESYKIVLKEG